MESVETVIEVPGGYKNLKRFSFADMFPSISRTEGWLFEVKSVHTGSSGIEIKNFITL